MTSDNIPEFVENPGFKPRDPVFYLGRAAAGDLEWTPNSAPHLMVGGGTGAGKTVLLQNLAIQAAKNDWKVQLLFSEGKTHLSVDDVVSELSKVHHELVSRYRKMEKLGEIRYSDIDAEPMLIMIDGLDDLISREGNDAFSDVSRDFNNLLRSLITSILRLGRAAGIQLAISARDVEALGLDNEVVACISSRVILRGAKIAESEGVSEEMMEKISKITGRSVVKFFSSHHEVQLYGPPN